MYLSLLLPLVGLVLAALVLQPISAQAQVLSPEDNQAKQDIIEALSAAVDHRYSQYDMINVSRSYDNSSFTIYNKSGFVQEPPVVCGAGTELEDNVCVPIPPEPVENETETNGNMTEPEPEPTVNETVTVALVGDIDGSEIVDAVSKSGSDYNVALGDLGYDNDLSWFKEQWSDLNNPKCVIGNHDSPEDGSESIYREAKALCGDIWFEQLNNSTVMIGFNTQGNLQTQLTTAKDYINQHDSKNVVLLSHKPCATPPKSHHGVESSVKAFCDGIAATGANVYGIAGHNHFMAETQDGKWYVSGSGGRSHYEGQTGSGWNYFNNDDDGYLKLTIKGDNVESSFYGVNGGLIH